MAKRDPSVSLKQQAINAIIRPPRKKYDLDELKKTLDKLAKGEYGVVVRSKGIIKATDNNWYAFNLTPEEVEIVPNKAINIGKIVVIGSKIDEENIKKLF